MREQLSKKISGTHIGMWLLIPELLRLGAWDILKSLFEKEGATSLSTHIGMQLVNESAIGVNRLRIRGSLANQGFSIANGLSFLAADETVHELLDSCTVNDYKIAQEKIYHMRTLQEHYSQEHVYALDPHRILSNTKRIMPLKKKKPDAAASKVLQTFFCVDVNTGQPIAFTNGSSGKKCSSASIELMEAVKNMGVTHGLFLSDKEHFTKEIAEWFTQNKDFEILMPAPETKKIKDVYSNQEFTRQWAGYATAEATYAFDQSDIKLRMIIQREGEVMEEYRYKGFLTTSNKSAVYLLSDSFPKRWTIENFFNFEQSHGWANASTMNLNIKYGKQTLALLAQAATHQLKQKLPGDYSHWTAKSLADNLLTSLEGDIRVKKDKIIVTYYGDQKKLELEKYYSDITTQLVNEGISPKIPWLLGYELEFKFK